MVEIEVYDFEIICIWERWVRASTQNILQPEWNSSISNYLFFNSGFFIQNNQNGKRQKIIPTIY